MFLAQRRFIRYCFILLLLFVAGCADKGPEFSAGAEPLTISLTVDGEQREITTEATNVRELLEEAGVEVNPDDIVDPPTFRPLEDGLEIRITRVTESIETIEQSIPFQRRTVRNESMGAEESPLIIQGGNPGLQEITVRIVYHDGLEFTRQETEIRVVESAQDEIVMVGVGAAPGNVEFDGLLAFISGGNSIILRGSSDFPEQINTGPDLDRRIFALSPAGNYLLYTRSTSEDDHFNALWFVSTDRGARPQSLGVFDVLWAGWNPNAVGRPQIAYTTGIPTDQLPGWEANNDLWLGDIPITTEEDAEVTFEPEQLVEAYPATYGWWGGNYAWSPNGRYLAYSYADEVGIIDTQPPTLADRRVRLQSFTEYNTRADWVWVPALSWSPDGEYLVFPQHAGDDPEAANFDTWVVDVANGFSRRFIEQTGIWSYAYWSPNSDNLLEQEGKTSQVAFLRANNPLDSLRSTYTLWLMDRDGSNARQIYPPAGENSHFPQQQQFMAWGETGRDIAFIYDNALYMLNLDSGEARRITQDDAVVSNPTWAPYGAAIGTEIEDIGPPPTPESSEPDLPPGGFTLP
ncbi:MAG: ubiquitin-like domain-containing protein [Candidatus Promineifilaceae bacterium]